MRRSIHLIGRHLPISAVVGGALLTAILQNAARAQTPDPAVTHWIARTLHPLNAVEDSSTSDLGLLAGIVRNARVIGIDESRHHIAV